MHSAIEILKIGLAVLVTKITPRRLHTRLCRLIYNYNSNRGLDWVVDYQPLPGIRKMKMLVNTKEFVGWNIFFLKHYEQGTNLILQANIKEGMCVVEAGAHVGSETLLIAALVGEQGKVCAFEPNPPALKRLRLNVLLNDFSERVALSDIALGARAGDMAFYVNYEDVPNQGQSSKYRFGDQVMEIQVRQQKLDDWVGANQIPRVDFLKMDVQGAEIDILNGASGTIARFKPVIFCEADETTQADSNQSLGELYQKLMSLGYRTSLILPDGKTAALSTKQLKAGNWLALPS